MSREELRRVRWRHVSLVFQSAMNVLNPVMRVGDQFVDMYKAHDRIRRSDALARAGDLLELVGIERARVRSYPHELSGGMRQRVVIAMALALEPELIVMDEPTTALDVVVQREILQELEELKRRLGFAVLFITHDLSLLVEFSDRIAIMYAGEVVESAPSDVLFHHALHPYTNGLMSSFPPLTGPILPLTGIAGRAARPRQAAVGLPLPPALPAVHRDRQQPAPAADRRAARPARDRARATRSPATGWRGHEHARGPGPRQALPRARRGPAARAARRRRRRLVHAAAGLRDGARRRERQRQEHRRAPARAALRADRRQDPLRRQGRRRPVAAQHAARVPLARPDDLPGPVRVAQSRQAHRSPPRAAAADPRDLQAPRGRRARARAARARRARAAGRDRAEVPSPALGRAAPARRDRARARRRAERDPRRRADLDARRVDPDRHPQSHPPVEAGARNCLPLHHARHCERALRRRRGPRDVPRPHRRAGPDRRRAARAAARLHEAAALGRAQSRERAAAGAAGARRARRRERLQARRGAPRATTSGGRHEPHRLCSCTRCARPRPRDFEATLREVAAFGYEGVELFDLHGHEPEQVAAWLEELGLVACSRHARLETIETRARGAR